jgi:hypothetical protein
MYNQTHLLYCTWLISIPILALPYHIWHSKLKCLSEYTEIFCVNYKLKATAHSFNLMELHITTHCSWTFICAFFSTVHWKKRYEPLVTLILGFYLAGYCIKQAMFSVRINDMTDLKWRIRQLNLHTEIHSLRHNREYWLDEYAGWQMTLTLNSTNNMCKLSWFIVLTHRSLVAELWGGYPEYAAHAA